MNDQMTFGDLEHAGRKRITKREKFLDTMDEIIPWDEWCILIEPYYYPGKRGRKPRGIETMLRMYLLQIWFSLSDEGVEEAVCDSYAMKKFMKIDFLSEQVPDATTLLKFRHIIEEAGLGKAMFDALNDLFDRCGVIMHGGTIVDATIIAAAPSTKNKTGERDPEMHQTKKGNQWYFGMKAHIGVDAGSGLVHTVTATAASVHDITETASLVRDGDTFVYGDSGYLGIEKRDEVKDDDHLSKIDWIIARKPSHIKGLDAKASWEKNIESRKASVRSKVEHPFLIVKRQFGCRKAIYRGIKKNLNRLHMAFACANLVMCSRAGRTLVPLHDG